MNKLCIRSYIKTRLLLGLNAIQIYDELVTACGKDAVSYRTIARWVQRFSMEQQSLEDNPLSGRPITAITQ
jgi:transposase